MGVIGLWSILDAGARPVRLETLAKKRLAIDASIWIYQFLKAVRDKEGNVLKNAHVVGFFRRICKLLFHGIKPVFVFDGKAPLLKKHTLRNRRVLREGGRVDVVKTAGKILAVQMRKRALEEKQRQDAMNGIDEEAVPDDPVYYNQVDMKAAEIQAQRFKKADQYHLPELSIDIDKAGSAYDPRIMTHEELQAYAKDFEGGEDMNLYDFSKIDYDSEMFTSLPLADQYSILNAARLRSRLRMGLSVEQLTDMFPDRMAFSRFQVERVKERSDLTNRLMNLNGMNEIGAQRIASERGREYVLVKNDTVDGGWSLGLVNNAENPIVIDKALQEASEEEDEGEFEDVPISNDSTEKTSAMQTEEAMIKFALEESRRAQLSSTRPSADFRPSKRRPAPVRKATDSTPLFARSDSDLEMVEETRHSSPMSIAQDQVDRVRLEVQEAEELRKAIDLSLEKETEPEVGGGFILEDEDDIVVSTLAHTSHAKPAVAPVPKFSLPFEKLDFSSSMLAARDATSKANPNVNKIEKAIQALEESDTEPQTNATADLPTSEPPQNESKEAPRAIPDWFAESVDDPMEFLPPPSKEPEPKEREFLGGPAQQTYDLTKEAGEERASSPVMITEAASAKITKSITPSRSPSPVEEAVGSPDWSDSGESDAEDNAVEPPLLRQQTTSTSQPGMTHEDSVLDEVDQQRLLEDDDMMARMAAEDHEYARFSAELGNKNVNTYTNDEYEQDLKTLKNQQKKNLRDADEVTQIMVLECQELLAQFGIPYITAASEAESQCARLVQLNLVDGIVTDDSDVFLFGGTRVYRNMFNAAKTVECYVLSDLEREFDLDRDRLIKLAYLLGSDYTEGIKKIGPVLAVELISEFQGETGLEDFRDYVDRVQADKLNDEDKSSPFRKKFRKTAEKLVLPDNFPSPLVRDAYIKPEVDEDTSTFEWGTPDVDALRKYLMKQCNWRQEYTDSQLLPVIKDMNMKQREGTQRNLTQFFSGAVGAGVAPSAKKAVKSHRMHSALTSLRSDAPATSRKRGSTDPPTPRKQRRRKDVADDDNE